MTTENHGLEQPSKGESDWHVPLNENTAALDTLVEIRDSDANKDDYTPKDGAKYLATDTGDVYLGDGSAWTRLGGIDDQEAIADPDVLDARDYGGDVGGDQIRAALDDAEAADAAVVVVRGHGPDDVSQYPTATRGTAWLLQSALELPSNTVLWLQDTHLFLDGGTEQNLIRNQTAGDGTSDRNENIHVRGDGATFLNGNGRNQNRPIVGEDPQVEPGAMEHFGVFLHKVDRATVSGFQLGRTAGWGIVAQDFSDVSITDVTFRQDGTVYNQDGVSFIGPGVNGRAVGLQGTCGDDVATIYADAGWLNPSVGSPGDVRHVGFHDIAVDMATDIGCGIRLQTGSGTTVENVTVSDVRAEGARLQLRNINDPNDYSDLRNVTATNLTFDDGGGGLFTEGRVENVHLSSVTMTDSSDAFFYPNLRDASPVASSVRNLTVEQCHVETTGKLIDVYENTDVLENVTFRDVHYEAIDPSGAGARILLYSTGTVRDLTLENLTLTCNPEYEALYARPEQDLENVTARNLTVSDVSNAISIQSNAITPPVTFTNVTADGLSGATFDVAPTGVVTEGVGTESANAQRPSEGNWSTGDVVAFTDTGNGDGTGLYLLLPDGNWSRIGAT